MAAFSFPSAIILDDEIEVIKNSFTLSGYDAVLFLIIVTELSTHNINTPTYF